MNTAEPNAAASTRAYRLSAHGRCCAAPVLVVLVHGGQSLALRSTEGSKALG